MSAKSQQNLFKKVVVIVFFFLYLQLVLWSTLLRPAIDIDVLWVPKSFFSSAKQSTCSIRMHHTPMLLFESTFFATIALLGHFHGRGGVWGVDPGIYGRTSANFEESMMGFRQKYCWMCFVPWIITFVQNWLENFGELLMLIGSGAVFEAHNFLSSVAMLMLLFSVQELVASEVVRMALQGYSVMQNIHGENMLWEQRKRILGGDSLNIPFEAKH